MKKLLICMVMVTMAVCANAQITWNVRAGVGIQQYINYDGWDGTESEVGLAPVLMAETNIPLKKGSQFTLSPSISIAYGGEETMSAAVPLHLGYKIPIKQNILFCPKAGITIGYIEGDGDEVLFGPSIAIPFEINHIVVAANANVSLINDDTLFGAYLTFGYKF